MNKIFGKKALVQIPIWIIVLCMLCFFPLGICLLIMRKRNNCTSAAKLLLCAGAFWLVCALIIVVDGGLQMDFVLPVVLTVAAAWCQLSCGWRLLQGKKTADCCQQSPQVSASCKQVVCQCCGAINAVETDKEKCEYCGMPFDKTTV